MLRKKNKMKNRKLIYTAVAVGLTTLSLTSCNDFLDKMPDNRTVIDTEQKVISILTSAYPTSTYIYVAETSSDNTDSFGETNPYSNRFADQVFAWQNITEDDNESPESFYESSYSAIASANAALEAIDNLGGPTTQTLRQARAEALLCRAYNHFMLANMFCRAYDASTADKELGIPYSEAPESKVGEHYERGTLAEVYSKIDRDLQDALPDVGDSYYTVPKYHFNKQAALAFATRFYLYYNKWDKAVEYATQCLGSRPSSVLRDYDKLGTLRSTEEAATNEYINSSSPANLLLSTALSNVGLVYGPYRVLSRYTHSPKLASSEDISATNIWGGSSLLRQLSNTYNGANLSKTIMMRLPYLFEYDDPVAGTGYRRTVAPLFTTDEVLLNRAEAYTLLKQYDLAAADLTTWMRNFVKTSMTLTPQSIQAFYGKSMAYSYEDEAKLVGTLKKHLHPLFSIDEEGSVQESMLQCVLNFKRLETLQLGLRWFDVKRYRIVIPRRLLNSSGDPAVKLDELTVDDKRTALQLPRRVIDAGMQPNPRD